MKEGAQRKLEGWKQIAAYLGRSTNTAKSWSKDYGLPVHRVGSGEKPRYYAWTGEIEQWERRRDRVLTGQAECRNLREAERREQVSGGTGTISNSVRRPLRWRLALAGLLALVLVVVALGSSDPQVVPDYNAIALGVERPGYEWPEETLEATRWAGVRLEEGGPELIAAIPLSSPEMPDAGRRRLRFLDAETREELRTVLLPHEDNLFPEFSNRYTPRVRGEDLNEDGLEEILITYIHLPNYPCYTVLHEPQMPNGGRHRVVFASTGHHYYRGAADLDDDGSNELIFEGPNNLLGWHRGVAAVSLKPAIDQAGDIVPPAVSPNRASYTSWNGLLWYTLMPPGVCNESPACLEIDHERRTLALRYSTPVILDFDGFDAERVSSHNGNERGALRKATWDALRRSQSQLRAGFAGKALQQARSAVSSALASEDVYLAEWSQRHLVVVLIHAGRFDEAKMRLSKLVQEFPELAGSLLFEPAVAFHLVDQREEALRLYEQRFRVGGMKQGGDRPPHEFLRGLILVLGEGNSVDELELASRKIDRFAAATYHAGGWLPALRAFLSWQRGGARRLEPPDFELNSADLVRYWRLELLREREELRKSGLLLVRREYENSSYPVRPLLMSLEALLLDARGDALAAREIIWDAYQATREGARHDPILKTHLPIVKRRFDQLAAGWTGRSESPAIANNPQSR